MNYRHAFHAGNFADVLKHVVLTLCLEHLKKKSAPFRVVDTHAGAGVYRLGSGESDRTGEWHEGIGSLIGPNAQPLPAPAARVLKAYFDALQRCQPVGASLAVYPGSPVLAADLIRSVDRVFANELHPEDSRALAKHFAKDRRVKVSALDGYIALKSLLPPAERRGLVLIDPPFEQPGEFIRLTEGLDGGLDRFKTGMFVIWYPIKDLKPVARFHRGVAEVAVRHHLESVLAVDVMRRAVRNPDLLNGCGLIVANPPFTLARDLAEVLPELVRRFKLGVGASGEVRDLAAGGG